jgi:predicted RNA binding protein YcfA (HicA-like mRNA interferase family)
MPELSGFSGRKTISILEKMGFLHIRTRGSHAVLRRLTDVCIVPLHDELASGTLRNVLKQAGIAPKDFLANE